MTTSLFLLSLVYFILWLRDVFNYNITSSCSTMAFHCQSRDWRGFITGFSWVSNINELPQRYWVFRVDLFESPRTSKGLEIVLARQSRQSNCTTSSFLGLSHVPACLREIFLFRCYISFPEPRVDACFSGSFITLLFQR